MIQQARRGPACPVVLLSRYPPSPISSSCAWTCQANWVLSFGYLYRGVNEACIWSTVTSILPKASSPGWNVAYREGNRFSFMHSLPLSGICQFLFLNIFRLLMLKQSLNDVFSSFSIICENEYLFMDPWLDSCLNNVRCVQFTDVTPIKQIVMRKRLNKFVDILNVNVR